MSLKEKYAHILKLIDSQPEAQRKRAVKRFFLLIDFYDNFLPQHDAGLKSQLSKALTAYSNLRGIPLRTLFRWHSTYQKGGIIALVPRYRATSSPEKYRDKYKLSVTMTMDTRAPLGCLVSLQHIIKRCRTIKTDVKKTSLAVLQHYFNGVTSGAPLTLTEPLTVDEMTALTRHKNGNHKKESRKAMAILMANDGRTLMEVREATHAAPRTIYRWLSNFNRGRLDSIKVRVHAPVREALKEQRQTRVVDIIHKTPSIYGINRTSWTYPAICEAYQVEYGGSISVGQVAAVVKASGYSWRRARAVLTSPDPEYKPKVEKILETLRGLKDSERFFFVDEVGPYRVKKYGGQRLSLKDQVEAIPAQQRGRGKVQFVAALEAVSNQMIWQYTPDKTAASFLSLFDSLVTVYRDYTTLYITWDAISVHSANAVKDWIGTHNARSLPRIEVVPLPANAQFLNVIEAVFGGMKRAVICNSDYAGPEEMKEAISRYFEERNQYYRDNPKRAGNKIWDKQAFDIDRLIGGLFKRM